MKAKEQSTNEKKSNTFLKEMVKQVFFFFFFFYLSSLNKNNVNQKNTILKQNIVFKKSRCGILGQVWYLILMIPDLCHLSFLRAK